jgi:hypothetical protein
MVITLLGFIGLRCWLGGDEAQMMVGGFSFKKVNNMEEEKSWSLVVMTWEVLKEE